jgi:hypothetical protein
LENIVLPDFLGIGAQKSATSWLHKVLQFHPKIFMAEKKEVHFFDLDYINGLEWYSNHFLYGGDKKKGEITPAYAMLSEDAVQYIHKIMPNTRLIYLLRNPIDRAWSHALMEFLIVQKRKYEEIPREEFLNHFQSEGSTNRGDYSKCIENWLKYFSQEQLYLGYFEEVKDNPENLIKEILQHIGVNPEEYKWEYAPIKQKVLEGSKVEMPEEYRKFLKDLYKDRILKLNEKYNNQYTQAWVNNLN